MDPKGLSFSEHEDMFMQNMNGPFPIFLNKFDEALAIFVNQLDHVESFSSAKMFVAAQTSLRCAVLVCKGGNTTQSTPLLRHALECSIYGFAFRFDRSFYRDWKTRETERKAKDRMRRQHTIRSKIQLVGEKSVELKQKIEKHYDMLISYGAHPNVNQIDGGIEFFFEGDSDEGMARIAIFGDEADRRNGYAFCGATYEYCLSLLKLVWPDRYHLLGIEAAQRDAWHETIRYQRLSEI